MSPLAREDVLDLVAALVDKSLVTMVDSGYDARYEMHASVSQYGAEQLAAADEGDQVRTR